MDHVARRQGVTFGGRVHEQFAFQQKVGLFLLRVRDAGRAAAGRHVHDHDGHAVRRIR